MLILMETQLNEYMTKDYSVTCSKLGSSPGSLGDLPECIRRLQHISLSQCTAEVGRGVSAALGELGTPCTAFLREK